jgi:putative phosphoesterase
MGRATETRIAVISDTHGRLDRRVLEFCATADHIIHAGDVGAGDVLDELARLAPLTAVRGNRDRGALGADLPDEVAGEVAGLRFVVAHKRRDLKAGHPNPASEGLGLLVYGHTHQPELRYRGHVPGQVPVLWLNPGSASAPLTHDPCPSVGLVVVRGGEPDARIVFLAQSSRPALTDAEGSHSADSNVVDVTSENSARRRGE